MKEFVKKMIKRLEEKYIDCNKNMNLVKDEDGNEAGHIYNEYLNKSIAYENAIEIVNEFAKEYKLLENIEQLNNGWIPCSERLPNKQGSYLIQDNHNNIKVAHYDYNTQHTYMAWWIDYTKVNVVAWCELPALYKED